MKHLWTKLFLFASLSSFTATEASAQIDDPDVPPVTTHLFDFENLPATVDAVKGEDIPDDTITMGGKRWALHGARIVNDSVLGIPQGNAALEIRAGYHNGRAASIELLDTIHGASIAFQLVHEGLDRLINRSQCWVLEATFDGGETWAQTTPVFDSAIEPSMQQFWVPVNEGGGYRFRIRFKDGDNNQGRNWAVLLDNIVVMAGDGYNVPWYIQPGNLYSGYVTSEESISFPPAVSGSTFFFGPEEYGGKHSVEMRLDGNLVNTYTTLPMDMVMTVNGLTPGKHHINIRFTNRKGVPVANAMETNFDVWMRPAKQVGSVRELLNATPGETYELVPEAGKSIIVNWASRTRAQRWLWDGDAGILLDDPQYLAPVGEEIPDHALQLRKARGQLITIGNNRLLRLDSPAEIDTLASDFTFTNLRCDDISLITANPDKWIGAPLCLYNVRLLPDPTVGIDCRPNAMIPVEDAFGNQMIMENIFSDRFTRSRLPQSERMMIFGIVGRNMLDGTPSFFPIEAHEVDPTGISHTETTTAKTVANKYNLAGQRVGDDYKGIVIVNGRKYIQR